MFVSGSSLYSVSCRGAHAGARSSRVEVLDIMSPNYSWCIVENVSCSQLLQHKKSSEEESALNLESSPARRGTETIVVKVVTRAAGSLVAAQFGAIGPTSAQTQLLE